MLDTTKLITLAAEYGAALTPEQAERFDVYARLLVEWNEKMNLTAITDPEGMLVKHFVDSLTLAPFLPEGGFSLIDVGTGAGFPGVPVAILRPDCRLTLLDSLNKRLTFLETLCREVGVTATRVHARAEEGGRQAALRDRFDVATARAVAGLPLLCEYCLPFVKPGGRFLALKGPDGEAELVSAKKALIELKGKPEQVVSLTLPGDNQRRLIAIRKTAPTPPPYPRPTAKIAKNPLSF